MNLSSMTGFARTGGEINSEGCRFSWFWEIKSVNGKALDVKVKLPAQFENLGLTIKNTAAKFASRGSVSILLNFDNENREQEVKINEKLLQTLAIKAVELYESYPDKFQKPAASDLLNARGVIESREQFLDEEHQLLLERKLLESLERGCRDWQNDRIQEGEKIRTVLLAIVGKIQRNVDEIESLALEFPQKLKEKLLQQIKELLDNATPVSEERLAQEVTLYVARADIREEIDRLQAHLKTARDLLSKGGTPGRRLDFLCQELNREANTTCSKSCDIEVTNLGMELKTLIEQLREQVQNIE